MSFCAAVRKGEVPFWRANETFADGAERVMRNGGHGEVQNACRIGDGC